MKKLYAVFLVITCLVTVVACASTDSSSGSTQGNADTKAENTSDIAENQNDSSIITDSSAIKDNNKNDSSTITYSSAINDNNKNDSSTITDSSAINDNNKNDAKVIVSAFTKQQHETIKYWLYTPENPKENMPLIVYLHGGSGKGDDLELITAADGFPQYLRDGKLSPSAYVIIPQVSSAYKGWGENKADVMKLITFVTEEYKIDEKCISLTGHSMGGTGTWQFALAYPNTFSAVAPLSGSVKLTDANINKLKNMPVWAIVGLEDTIVDPQSSIDFIAELTKVNKAAKLTELDGADHFEVPNLSYLSNEFDLIEWLLAQTK